MKNKHFSLILLIILFSFFQNCFATDDATFTQFSVPTGTLERGTEHTCTIEIENTGTTTREFWIGLSFAHESTTRDNWPQGWYDIKPVMTRILVPGERQEIEFSFIIPDYLNPGQFYAFSRIWNNFNALEWLMSDPIYDESTEHTEWYNNELGLASFNLGAFDNPPEDIIGQLLWGARFVAFEGSDLMNMYINQGQKPLLYFNANVNGSLVTTGTPLSFGAGATFLIDLDDLFQFTPEGEEGWVTMWIDAEGSLGLGYEISNVNIEGEIGITYHNFDYPEKALADDRREWGASIGASIPGFAITLVEYQSDGGIQRPRIQWTGTAGVTLNISGDANGFVSWEVNVQEIKDAIINAFSDERNLYNSISELSNNLSDLTTSAFRITSWDDGSWMLTDGQWETNLKLSKTYNPNNEKEKYAHHFFIDVLNNTDVLRIITNGGTPNADLYLSYNEIPINSPQYTSSESDNDESIIINNPTAGKWYIMLPSITPYDGLNLVASTETNNNQSPGLSNPRVEPLSGTESTNFKFLIDYFDPDGDPPLSSNRNVFINDQNPASAHSMTLESGSESDGTYSYSTTFSPGSYQYFFSFINGYGQSAITGWKNGPNVYSNENIIINPVIHCPEFSQDLKFGYRSGDTGPFTYFNITGNTYLAPINIPTGSTIWFTASSNNENFEYDKMILKKGDQIIHESQNSFWINFGTSDYGTFTLNAYYNYTPKEYTISGTVLDKDGQIIPDNVILNLKSSQQEIIQISSDGIFSFTGIQGGVSVSITAGVNGYSFSPVSLVFNNLKENYANQSIIGYSNDITAPNTILTDKPDSITQNSTVTFNWIGTDDVSASDNILFQYILEEVDDDWSTLNTNKSVSYNLANGLYTFKVRAEDESGNLDQSPISYTFIVNANPKIISYERTNRGVWSSKIKIEMPVAPTNPSRNIVLNYKFSGINDNELIPIKIYRIKEDKPIGTSDIISEHLSIEPLITFYENNSILKLPDTLLAGQSIELEIEWGKIKYFGWQEFNSVPLGFSNGGNIIKSYLDENLNLWRSATRNNYRGLSACEKDGSLLIDISNKNSIINESLVQFIPGECLNGDIGNFTEFLSSNILESDLDNLLLWTDYRYEFDGTNNYYYKRYGLQTFNKEGDPIAYSYGNYSDRSSINLPRNVINNSIWIVCDRSLNPQNTSNNAFFTVLDESGNVIIPETIFDEIQNDNGADIDTREVIPIGDNVLFLWERSWETTVGDYRQEIKYQIRDYLGNIVYATTSITPNILSDEIEYNDFYYIEWYLTDKTGKVWLSYKHSLSGQPAEYFYIVINNDGTFYKNATQTTNNRVFSYCDKDGYIWINENDQFYMLRDDDSYIIEPRNGITIPNQDVRNISASVTSNGYRLYDRWSPQLLNIDIANDVKIDTLEIYDLNMWDNDLHPSNLEIKKEETTIWHQVGQFDEYSQVNLSDLLNHGQNVISMTQDNILGGQILITFPLSPETYRISGKVSLNDATVNLTEVKIILEGNKNDTINPDSTGFYSFTDLLKGKYSIYAELENFSFCPIFSYEYNLLDTNYVNQNFTGVMIIPNNISESICQGENIQIGDSIFTESGNYMVSLINQYGCDSVIKLNLTVNPLPFVNIGNYKTITENDTTILSSNDNFINYLWNTSETTSSIMIIGKNVGIGKYDYWLRVEDENNCVNFDTIQITITESTNISNILSSGFVKFYPNPTNDFLNIEINGVNEKIRIELISENGSIVLSRKYQVGLNIVDKLDLKGFNSGWYIIKTQTETEIKTNKFLLIK